MHGLIKVWFTTRVHKHVHVKSYIKKINFLVRIILETKDYVCHVVHVENKSMSTRKRTMMIMVFLNLS